MRTSGRITSARRYNIFVSSDKGWAKYGWRRHAGECGSSADCRETNGVWMTIITSYLPLSSWPPPGRTSADRNKMLICQNPMTRSRIPRRDLICHRTAAIYCFECWESAQCWRTQNSGQDSGLRIRMLPSGGDNPALVLGDLLTVRSFSLLNNVIIVMFYSRWA